MWAGGLPTPAFIDPRVPVQGVHSPAKKNKGRLSSKANQCSGLRFVTGSGRCPYSEKAVAGTTQRWAVPSQRRQCGLAVLRMFVTPVSGASGAFRNCGGVGMPQVSRASSRPSGVLRTTGAARSG